jgi:ribosome-associated translation inhibitor RaiA
MLCLMWSESQFRVPHPSAVSSTGAFMKLSINYKHVESHKPVEVEVGRHVAKLEKLLKSYSPDLVQLHGGFSKNPRTEEISCVLNLSIPTGTLHATGVGGAVRASCKKAFSELESQVKKHQAKLRKDYEWKRKRLRIREEAFT